MHAYTLLIVCYLTFQGVDLITPVLGKPRFKNLIDTLLNVKKVENVRNLRRLYSV